jgi:L-alanine-DL-glutamate epimerase-like enolase superfamily enzyme
MATYDLIADLPVQIEGYDLEAFVRPINEQFTRHTTVYRLHGGGETGLGEDVTYGEEEQLAQQQLGPVLPLAGDFSLRAFSELVGGLDLFQAGHPEQHAFLDYRRWAIESAALDLALRQAGRALHEVLGREPKPVTFVVSTRLGSPPTMAAVDTLLERYPGTRFKLDATPEWSDELIDRLVAAGAVDALDFKSFYKGTIVDVETDPDLYRRCAEAFPEAKLEDPDVVMPEARAVLEPHADRITWDAPIHSVQDILDRPFEVRSINVKPSRAGSLERLFDIYDFCAEHDIACYAGGQGENTIGRGQNQLLAGIFHPDGPNDIAPTGYDWTDPPAGLPANPLDPAPEAIGFRRRVDS